jgi:hypothetical protein
MRKVIAFLLVASASAAADKRTEKPRYGIPALRPGELWVSSVPTGLDVYLAGKPEGKPVGRTPILLDAKSLGPEVTVKLLKSSEPDLGPSEDLVDFTSQVTHELWHEDHDGVKTRLSVALTYRVDPHRKQTLIALFQPKSSTLSDWARRYAPGNNFSFRADKVRKDLASRGVPDAFLDLGISLLRRGGKVALPARDGWLIAEVLPLERVRMLVLRR